MRALLREGVLLAGVFLLPTSGPLAAQDGTVQGRVRDDEGTAVYRAAVMLLGGETPVVVVDTDELGLFCIFEVAPGPYTVRVQGLGYTESSEEIVVGLTETVELDLRLQRSAIRLEGISAEAERSRERARFDQLGGVTVRELSLADVRMVPGLAEPDPVRALEVLPGVVSTSDFSASFHVRGGSHDQNLILLDGMPIFSPFHLGGVFSVFNADMIDRVELHSGGFPAEHGGRVSSVLQIESNAGDGDFSVEGAVSLLATRVAVGGRLGNSLASTLGFGNVRYRVSARRSYLDLLFGQFPYHLTDYQTVVEGWTPGGDRLTITAYKGRDVIDLASLDLEDFPLRIDWDWGNDAVGARWTHPRRGGGSLGLPSELQPLRVWPHLPRFRRHSAEQQDQTRPVQGGPGPTSFAALFPSKWGRVPRLYPTRTSSSTGGTEFASGIGKGWLLGTYVQTRWSHAGRMAR